MQRRIATALSALAALTAIGLATHVLVGDSRAELENPGRDTEPRVFASARDRIRMVVPRAWRATDQASYPGLILWMMRNQPPGQIVLTAEAFTRDLYCAWPVTCRAGQDSLTAKFACALRTKLGAQRLRVGPTQPGPKENAAAGLPSVWFEYEDGKRFVRHAVALTADRAFSLVLSSPTADARAAHVRVFDQMLRTLRPLTDDEAEAEAPSTAAGAAGASSAPAVDAGAPPPGDAAVPGTGDAAGSRGAAPSAPAPKINPVGPCS